MYIIYILAVLLILGLAKKGRRKFRRYLRGQIDTSQALGTLANNSALKLNVSDTVIDSTWISSIVASWSIKNMTPAAGQGPILVGVAHSDYTAAEIEEWIESSESWNSADLRTQEQARRKIRRVGLLIATTSATEGFTINHGNPVKTKCNWVLQPGQTMSLWFYNTGTVALATTDPVVTIQGHANLWPM